MSRRSTMLAIALGFAATGATILSAGAMPFSSRVGNLSERLPSYPAASNASIHPASAILNAQPNVIAKTPVSGSSTHPIGGVLKLPPHVIAGIPAPGSSTHPIGGILKLPPHVIDLRPPYTGIDNVCPDNPAKCPPKPAPNPGLGAGNPGPGGQGAWPMPSLPGGPDGSGPVVVLAPPVAVQAPGTVITAANTGTNTAVAAAEPCNCLTKRYLDDGSVLFRDICTKEAAIVTPAELKTQAQGAMVQ